MIFYNYFFYILTSVGLLGFSYLQSYKENFQTPLII